MTESAILQWLIPLVWASVLGNILGVFVGLSYIMKHHEMANVVTDFRWYMKELVPEKYHVQGHKSAEPKPAPDESSNNQQT